MRSPTWTPPTRARVRRVRDRLREVYGIPLMAPHGDPIAELVLTVLSQSTNDRNRDVAYLRLREWFATWEDVMRAPVGKVEEAIRPGGISKVKSARIKAILQAIAERPSPGKEAACESGGRRVPSPRSARTSSRSTGSQMSRSSRRATTSPPSPASVARPRRACCCSPTASTTSPSTRTSRAWACACELLQPGASFEQLHDQMLALTPPGEELELHVNLLRHGRRTCHARKPACGECALARMCPSRGDFI